MGNDNVYAYNNTIVITTAVAVSAILLLVSLVFLLLLLRRKRLENKHQRAEKSANINHGHIPDYIDGEPQTLTVINEYPSGASNESKGVCEGYDDEQARHTMEEPPQPNERERASSSSAPYHFNFNEEHFMDGDVVTPMEKAQNTKSILTNLGEFPKEMEDTESDSDCDATFETIVA